MFTGKAARRTAVSFGILIVVLAISLATSGQTRPHKPASSQATRNEVEELRKEVRELKQSQADIQKELEEIKKLLLARSAPARPAPPERININARPIRGSESARVVVVEFSDYQCPYCGLFFRNTLPQLDEEYIKAGKIRYVFNHLPLEEIHGFAFKAAEATECAGEQGKFWELHNRLFSNQNALAPNDLTRQATAVGLDMARFSQCLASGRNSATIRATVQEAESLGIGGTPAFVIAVVDGKNPRDPNIKIVGVLGGAQPFPVFKQAIDKVLAQQTP